MYNKILITEITQTTPRQGRFAYIKVNLIHTVCLSLPIKVLYVCCWKKFYNKVFTGNRLGSCLLPNLSLSWGDLLCFLTTWWSPSLPSSSPSRCIKISNRSLMLSVEKLIIKHYINRCVGNRGRTEEYIIDRTKSIRRRTRYVPVVGLCVTRHISTM